MRKIPEISIYPALSEDNNKLGQKVSMSFPPNVKEDVMVACGRYCAICHKFCGIKIEIHHIVEQAEGGTDTYENAIPLCFDCHADMRSYDHKHPKGTKYTRTELVRHREAWYSKVAGNIGVLNRSEILETDKLVYSRLISILPWNGSISFIRSNNFAGFHFETDHLNQLHDFEHECKNPAFEFIDADLEGLRSRLASQIDEFALLIATETFPMRNGFQAVPPELEESAPDRFNRVVTQIHELAANVVETYSDLVRMATRKLGVLPAEFIVNA